MNWQNPEERARLLERVGPTVYRRLQVIAWNTANLEQVNGYQLRQIGGLVAVVGTRRAYRTAQEARRFADSLPSGELAGGAA